MSVSIFASAVRPKLWPSLFNSLKGTSCDYEVVFVGNKEPSETNDTNFYPIGFDTLSHYPENNLRFIKVGNLKPAQCYEIARRNCRMETVIWSADDMEVPNDVIGKAYKYWKSQNNEKLILSIQTKESGYNNVHGTLFDMNIHRFFGGNPYTPLMAPLGMMSRKWLDELGGLDRRYVCGQYENDIVMRAYAQGGKVEIFGGADCFIDIDHLRKSIEIGECTNDSDFRNRPFATGYQKDREVLENSWVRQGGRICERYDEFEPYSPDDIMVKSQSNKGKWD